MAATAADVNESMKEMLKTHDCAYDNDNPPKHGMTRTLLNELVVHDLKAKEKIKKTDTAAATCVRGVVGNLINRYRKKLKKDKTAAVREVKRDNSYWLNLDQEKDNADTDKLRTCGC